LKPDLNAKEQLNAFAADEIELSTPDILRLARLEVGLSQREVGIMMGSPRNQDMLRRVEGGEKEPTNEVIAAYCAANPARAELILVAVRREMPDVNITEIKALTAAVQTGRPTQ
jgi:transcriptional regulator with XRE-family HTH domain